MTTNPKRTGRRDGLPSGSSGMNAPLVGSPGGGVRTLVVGDTDGKEPSPIEIISQSKMQIGQVGVTFTVGRIRRATALIPQQKK